MDRYAWYIAALVSLALAVVFAPAPAPAITAEAAPMQSVAAAPTCAPDDLTLACPPQLSAAQLDAILSSYGSPATGTGAAWIAQAQRTGINSEIAVAFFVHESTAGTAQGWAGWKNDGSSTHNVGNVVCTPGWQCYGRFRDYPTWESGIADWYDLIQREYIQGRGHRTVADVVPVYAPSFENDVDGYIGAVQALVVVWRAQ